MRARAAALVLLVACSSAGLPVRTLRLSSGEQTKDIRVEVASTAEARRVGLMNRASVPDGTGMLFVYPRADAWGGYWMEGTLVALDVAFIKDGLIFEIHTLQPCRADPCPVTTPGGPFDRVLEVRAGWLVASGFGEGTRLG